MPDERNESAPVEHEESVHIRPVKLGRTVLCAIALSSSRPDPTRRLNELCCEFEYVLEWFFAIVANLARRGSLQPLTEWRDVLGSKTDATDADDSVGAEIELQLRKVKEWKSFQGDERRPISSLMITTSI
jgi:hypothetical protein